MFCNILIVYGSSYNVLILVLAYRVILVLGDSSDSSIYHDGKYISINIVIGA